jgi:hypothetical protein
VTIAHNFNCAYYISTDYYKSYYVQPYGFDVGNSERGNVLKGLDLGVEGMKVGGQVS